MESTKNNVSCPIFDKEIPSGLCWEICNIGNDSVILPSELKLPYSWKEANKTCNKCPVCIEMET